MGDTASRSTNNLRHTSDCAGRGSRSVVSIVGAFRNRHLESSHSLRYHRRLQRTVHRWPNNATIRSQVASGDRRHCKPQFCDQDAFDQADRLRHAFRDAAKTNALKQKFLSLFLAPCSFHSTRFNGYSPLPPPVAAYQSIFFTLLLRLTMVLQHHREWELVPHPCPFPRLSRVCLGVEGINFHQLGNVICDECRFPHSVWTLSRRTWCCTRRHLQPLQHHSGRNVVSPHVFSCEASSRTTSRAKSPMFLEFNETSGTLAK